MGAKKAKQKQQVAPTKDSRLLYFAREHPVGVVIVALLGISGAWLAWHVRDCLIDQKLQVTNTRKAWMNVRVLNQKVVSDREALVTRVELLRRDVRNGEIQTAFDLHRKPLFDISGTLNSDCNAFKASVYEVSRELKALGRSFSFDFDVEAFFDPSGLCEGLAAAGEKLRTTPTADRKSMLGESGHPDPQRLEQWFVEVDAAIKQSKAITEARKKTERNANLALEDLLVSLENQSFVRRARHCL